MSDRSLLYLYSSNIRPLYEQDILDLLAAPEGSLYQFRYEDRWVEQATRAEWEGISIGTTVLVHFSMQQRARYHDPVFFPVRRGTVKRMFVEGKALFVEFTVGEFVCLPEPAADSSGVTHFAQKSAEYAEYLKQMGAPRPYDASAGLGPNILGVAEAPIDVSGRQVEIFERLTKFLQQTDSFHDARFFRFLRLTPRGKSEDVVPDEAGIFELTAGRTYTLELFHFQPTDVPHEEPFTVSVDGQIVRVIGRAGFDIGSRYDRIAIDLLAVQSDRYEARETVLVIEPDEHVRGPQMRLHLRVNPPSKKVIAGSAASAVALVGLGSASLMPIAAWAKTGVIFVCAAAIVVLAIFGLYVPTLSGFSLAGLGGGAGTKPPVQGKN